MLITIKKTPIPIAGLMLALASGGLYISSYGVLYKTIFGLMASTLFILLTLKIILHPKMVLENMNNPVIASVVPTFSMGLMILSTYLKPYNNLLATSLWAGGFILHTCLIIWFTCKYMFKFNMLKVFPSYFIVYVGLVVASITGPVYGYSGLGQLVFWFGFISYLVLLPIVIYRLIKYPTLAEVTVPLIAILAAPASLCLAGYLSAFTTRNIHITLFLTILSLIMYVGVLIYLPKMLKLPFYPSYSAFTFPLVISGIGMKKVSGELIQLGINKDLIHLLIQTQEVIAVAIVLYVLIRYMKDHYLLTPIQARPGKNSPS